MALQLKSVKKGVPEGTHGARLIQVLDLGMQRDTFNKGSDVKAPSRKVHLTFEIPGELLDDGRPLVVSKEVALSAHKKAFVREVAQALLNKTLSDSEAKNVDVGSLVGKTCMLNVMHNTAGYAKVISVSPVPKGFAIGKQVNPSKVIDLDTISETELDEVLSNLPEFLRTKINERVRDESELKTDNEFDPK